MDLDKCHRHFIGAREIAQSETARGLQLRVRALKPSEKGLGNLALQRMARNKQVVARDICQSVEEGGVELLQGRRRVGVINLDHVKVSVRVVKGGKEKLQQRALDQSSLEVFIRKVGSCYCDERYEVVEVISRRQARGQPEGNLDGVWACAACFAFLGSEQDEDFAEIGDEDDEVGKVRRAQESDETLVEVGL